MSVYADETGLRRRLSVAAETAVPGGVDLWSAVRDNVLHGRGLRYRALRSRAGLVALAVVMFAVLGAVSYTAAPAISRLFQFTESLRTIDDLGAATELGLTQTDGAYTGVVERAYADANQVLVEFTTYGDETIDRVLLPPGHVTTLALRDGTQLPSGQFNIGITASSKAVEGSLPPGAQSSLLSFSTWPVDPSSDELDLLLTIKVVKPESLITDSEQGIELSADENTVVAATPASEYVTVATFEFEFVLPLNKGLEMVGGEQTIVQSDIPVVLERVVSTLSETRAAMRFDVLTATVPELEIKTPDGKRHTLVAGVGTNNMDWDFHFGDAISSQPGVWELTVKSSDTRGLVHPVGTPTAGFLEEPVTFRFEMASID